MYADELEINVPWGHIACKLWCKNTTNTPSKTKNIYLFVHNLHDNAASFDGMINHMQDGICVAIDLPGHGKSSWINPHATYHHHDNVLVLKYVIYNLLRRYNKQNQPKKQIILITHGQSAHLGVIFTQIYPKFISKLILLDGMYQYGVRTKHFVKNIRQSMDKYFEIENFIATKSPREYTLNEVYKKYANNPQTSNLSQTVSALVERGSRKIDNGNYLLRNDIRLENIPILGCGYHYLIDFLKKQPVQCPVLIICTKTIENQHKQFLNILKQKNKYVTFVNVDYSHSHIVHPDKIYQIMCKFLNINISKL